MLGKLITYLKLNAKRPHYLMVAFVFVFFIVSSIAVSNQPKQVTLPEADDVAKNTFSSLTLSESEPLQIKIPKLKLTADFEEPLGITTDNEVEVPDGYSSVGYYKYGPTPGELGPAVVLGHVDSVDGPAVFYSLGQLEVGDEIEILREDNTTAIFAVTKLERHLQSGFPTEEVYGNINHAGLRLITCSGTFDRGVQRYSHNLIVFAELKVE